MIDNQVVLISGGLGDIALATALAFSRVGARVALSDIHPAADAAPRLQPLQKEEARFLYHQVDIANPEAVSNWVADVAQTWGRIDIALVNAATITQKPIAGISPAEWQREIQINLNGAFFLAQQAAVYFSNHRIKGNIVFLGSWAAHAVHPHIPAYSVAKAGIRMLCQCMALEFAAQDIRVNEIAPGYVNAGLSKVVWDRHPDLAASATSKVPLGRLIEAGEVASQILWLCREDNRHVTGSCLLMDGGLSLLRP